MAINFFRKIVNDRYNLIMLANSIFFNLLIWIYLYIKIKPFVGHIPLHYNIYSGVDEIGDWRKIYIVPALGLGLIVINFVVYYFLIKNNSYKFIASFLTTFSFVVQIILAVAIYFMVNLFTSGFYE